ncbi:MAG: hypothetical protein FJ104_09510 [Deltaproteobacteria bacterium]|nr:hypothetical protein [Deltaproteobacteria bacterium]
MPASPLRAPGTSLALALAALFATAPAFAIPDRREQLQAEVGAPCDLQCTVCHTTNAGGGGTATKGFVQELLARGFDVGSAASLVDALAAMEGEEVDSDGDGAPDVAELSAGDDPNSAGGALCGAGAPATAEYGCARVAPRGLPAEGAGWLVAGLVAVAALRRRR